jgi:hypothetical protein
MFRETIHHCETHNIPQVNIIMMGILVTRLFNTKIRQNHNSEYNKKLHLDFMRYQINLL